MINLILFGTFFIMLLLNIPIAVSLGSSAILAMLYAHDPFTVISTNVYNGMAKFLLLAIPFFVLSGNIMAKAGISTRLVNFIDDCVGHRRGGIAIVCVIVACFFGAISGSGPATVAALGIILIPAMINRGGFSKDGKVQNGVWGAINKKGKIIIPCKYNDIIPYAGSERIEADGGYIKDIYDFNGNYLRSEYKW